MRRTADGVVPHIMEQEQLTSTKTKDQLGSRFTHFAALIIIQLCPQTCIRSRGVNRSPKTLEKSQVRFGLRSVSQYLIGHFWTVITYSKVRAFFDLI